MSKLNEKELLKELDKAVGFKVAAYKQIRELIKIFFAKEISVGPIKKDIPERDLIEWLQGLNQAATAMKDYYVMKATTQLIEIIQIPGTVLKQMRRAGLRGARAGSRLRRKVRNDWLPTPENINALPAPIRKYIADLETNADPPSMVQENALLRDTCKALETKLEEKSAVDEGFVNTWANDFATATLADKTMHKRIIYMLKEIDVEVVEK